MKHQLRAPFLVTVGLLLTCVIGGCAGSSHGESTRGTGLGLTGPEDSVAGTGFYLVENAYEAEFVDCTGQAAVLEGLTFVEGYALAPICVASGTFDVIQTGNTLSMVTHEVDCSDGSSATVSGTADFGADVLSGAWESTSVGGVSSSQVFSGTMSATSIRILESRRTFVGAFDGECAIAPALSATLTII
jgi:hypothetical protein